ncbi:hypothetical protein NDU88_008781 [Pleurodeles waltl]|uniref:Uncharacterized protein n=1 Tax=Pleurodeles waltl TaxID=8319 RepID=A0AAV7N885_PLEWA|nr:hypothetical protein NDU88_008781 [Pleurodeles waltl]
MLNGGGEWPARWLIGSTRRVLSARRLNPGLSCRSRPPRTQRIGRRGLRDEDGGVRNRGKHCDRATGERTCSAPGPKMSPAIAAVNWTECF